MIARSRKPRARLNGKEEEIMNKVKWSLTGETARAIYALQHKGPINCRVGAFRTAQKLRPEMKSAGTFESFLRVNGIEIVD